MIVWTLRHVSFSFVSFRWLMPSITSYVELSWCRSIMELWCHHWANCIACPHVIEVVSCIGATLGHCYSWIISIERRCLDGIRTPVYWTKAKWLNHLATEACVFAVENRILRFLISLPRHSCVFCSNSPALTIEDLVWIQPRSGIEALAVSFEIFCSFEFH